MRVFAVEGSATMAGADASKLRRFADAVARLYRNNPYHNLHHAVDVTNTLAWLLTRPVWRERFTPNQTFWMLVAALAHDLDHPGLNNQWEIYNHTERARKYGNVSILEHHAVDMTRALLERPELQFYGEMTAAQVEEGLMLMRELILATDFAMHRDFLNQLSAALDAKGQAQGAQGLDMLLVAKALIKAADIANTSRPYAQAKVWGLRVMKEFWVQGKLEQQHGFPVGPFNDPSKINLNQAQAGFIKFAALELFELLARLEPAMDEMVQSLRNNVQLYQESDGQGRASLEE